MERRSERNTPPLSIVSELSSIPYNLLAKELDLSINIETLECSLGKTVTSFSAPAECAQQQQQQTRRPSKAMSGGGSTIIECLPESGSPVPVENELAREMTSRITAGLVEDPSNSEAARNSRVSSIYASVITGSSPTVVSEDMPRQIAEEGTRSCFEQYDIPSIGVSFPQSRSIEEPESCIFYEDGKQVSIGDVDHRSCEQVESCVFFEDGKEISPGEIFGDEQPLVDDEYGAEDIKFFEGGTRVSLEEIMATQESESEHASKEGYSTLDARQAKGIVESCNSTEADTLLQNSLQGSHDGFNTLSTSSSSQTLGMTEDFAFGLSQNASSKTLPPCVEGDREDVVPSPLQHTLPQWSDRASNDTHTVISLAASTDDDMPTSEAFSFLDEYTKRAEQSILTIKAVRAVEVDENQTDDANDSQTDAGLQQSCPENTAPTESQAEEGVGDVVLLENRAKKSSISLGSIGSSSEECDALREEGPLSSATSSNHQLLLQLSSENLSEDSLIEDLISPLLSGPQQPEQCFRIIDPVEETPEAILDSNDLDISPTTVFAQSQPSALPENILTLEETPEAILNRNDLAISPTTVFAQSQPFSLPENILTLEETPEAIFNRNDLDISPTTVFAQSQPLPFPGKAEVDEVADGALGSPPVERNAEVDEESTGFLAKDDEALMTDLLAEAEKAARGRSIVAVQKSMMSLACKSPDPTRACKVDDVSAAVVSDPIPLRRGSSSSQTSSGAVRSVTKHSNASDATSDALASITDGLFAGVLGQVADWDESDNSTVVSAQNDPALKSQAASEDYVVVTAPSQGRFAQSIHATDDSAGKRQSVGNDSTSQEQKQTSGAENSLPVKGRGRTSQIIQIPFSEGLQDLSTQPAPVGADDVSERRRSSTSSMLELLLRGCDSGEIARVGKDEQKQSDDKVGAPPEAALKAAGSEVLHLLAEATVSGKLQQLLEEEKIVQSEMDRKEEPSKSERDVEKSKLGSSALHLLADASLTGALPQMLASAQEDSLQAQQEVAPLLTEVKSGTTEKGVTEETSQEESKHVQVGASDDEAGSRALPLLEEASLSGKLQESMEKLCPQGEESITDISEERVAKLKLSYGREVLRLLPHVTFSCEPRVEDPTNVVPGNGSFLEQTFHEFHCNPELPRGIEIDRTSGRLYGTAAKEQETAAYKICVDISACGRKYTLCTELSISVGWSMHENDNRLGSKTGSTQRQSSSGTAQPANLKTPALVGELYHFVIDAVRSGNIVPIKALLRRGVLCPAHLDSERVVDEQGCTLLDLARKSGHRDILSLFFGELIDESESHVYRQLTSKDAAQSRPAARTSGSITYPLLPNIIARGHECAYQAKLCGGFKPVGWESAPPLPSGLSLDPRTGEIRGTCREDVACREYVVMALLQLEDDQDTPTALSADIGLQPHAPDSPPKQSPQAKRHRESLERRKSSNRISCTIKFAVETLIAPQGLSYPHVQRVVPAVKARPPVEDSQGAVDILPPLKVPAPSPTTLTPGRKPQTPRNRIGATSSVAPSPQQIMPTFKAGHADKWTVDPPLPLGMVLDAHTGEISGVPVLTERRCSSSTHTVLAANAEGKTCCGVSVDISVGSWNLMMVQIGTAWSSEDERGNSRRADGNRKDAQTKDVVDVVYKSPAPSSLNRVDWKKVVWRSKVVIKQFGRWLPIFGTSDEVKNKEHVIVKGMMADALLQCLGIHDDQHNIRALRNEIKALSAEDGELSCAEEVRRKQVIVYLNIGGVLAGHSSRNAESNSLRNALPNFNLKGPDLRGDWQSTDNIPEHFSHLVPHWRKKLEAIESGDKEKKFEAWRQARDKLGAPEEVES